ncbi:winged helix-turn-helix domain-containing protein [Streptomyces sp. NPDC006460]|uniref:winged helix-turn-helix domain-containing protein n=1 Tax=Streptomyces sp. NPDC006460 TaxID=3154304 RepID=UPI0033BF21DD
MVAAALRSGINGGVIMEKLPSEADLVRAHGVSRNTVRRALNALAGEGLVESVPGSGWRVGRGAGSLVDRITGVITQDLLAVGDAFPSESRLCERFGASRTAVRRALAQMEGSGLLDTAHGKGRTVRALPGSVGQP